MFFDRLNCNVKYDEMLKNHTTFGVGGKCIAVVEPKCCEDIIETIKICNENKLKYFVIGNGSNLLVSDEGYNGVIIKLKREFSKIEVNENKLTIQSGAKLSEVFKVTLDNSLKGFEFASGIPGTIGGAIYMNAGAYGNEMKDVVEYVEVIDIDNLKVIKLNLEDLEFGYRKSIIQRKNFIVTSVTLNLDFGDKKEIKSIYEDLNERRNSKQPMDFKSAGSTFKRPNGYFASKLIEDSGLKGHSINDAQVSEKHAGFVINRGNASCDDILNLVNHIKKVVFDKFNVELEMEIKILKD